ncbi:3-hydroxyacyl-CoA dehydrogenase [Sporichthya brevicatena]|uniref:3-hydroxyacyl-CoA dehydrogenase n=1 Tax=Sporichthya brevicatena TaxID=171442 RepID=A0ABN1H3U1_9ACTN
MTRANAVALVFDQDSGLGVATARALHKLGATVVVAGPDPSGHDADVVLLENDWTDEDAVAQVCAAAREYGPIRSAVAISGLSSSRRLVDRSGGVHPLAEFDQALRHGLWGPFNVLRSVAAAMRTNEPDENGQRGVIVTTASVSAYDGQVGQVAYAAAKGGVVAMTLPAARDLAPMGIRVCGVAPGLFAVPKAAGLGPDVARPVLSPPRLGHPEEFAELVGHIVTNPYLNAEVIRLDGGLRLSAK